MVALYGAPVWADSLMAEQRSLAILRHAERKMAIRVARGYRTISYAVAMVLAGLIPMDLLAAAHTAAYDRRCEIRRRLKVALPGRAVELLRRQARQSTAPARE